MTETVLTNVDEGALTVDLNRPEVHNAFNAMMVAELKEVFESEALNKDVRVVVVQGRGPSFCAGADINSMRAAATTTLEQNERDAQAMFDLMLAIDGCPRPVIACVHGAVFGGGVGLVSACDIVIAAENTIFAFSETRLGLIPAVISPFVLAKIGERQARELFLTGERFGVARALRIGLVHQTVPAAALGSALNERVHQLLQAAPEAQTAAKKLIQDVVNQPKDRMRRTTARRIAERRASDEGLEGLRAFLEKRPPSWQS